MTLFSLPSTYVKELKKLKESEEDKMSDVEFNMSIEIDELVFQKIMHWIDKNDYEVSGLGSIEIDHDRNVIRVIDAILLKQENTSSATDLDDAAVGKAMYEHHRNQKPGQLKWWWHSHCNMSVFWSGTDISTIKKLGVGGWFVATVLNKNKETKSAFVQNSPIKLIADDIPTNRINQIVVDPWAEYREAWENEYENKVDVKSYSSWSNSEGEVTDYSDIVSRYHNQHGVVEEVEADEVDEVNEKEEYLDLDQLFELHEKKEITDEQLYDYLRAMDDPEEIENHLVTDLTQVDDGIWATEDGTLVDDDGVPLLSDEEALAMDIANNSFDDDEEGTPPAGSGHVPLI